MDLFIKNSQIETLLSNILRGQNLNLYKMMSYQMGWAENETENLLNNPPKRIFASLCLETNKALGGNIKFGYPAAVSVELLYNYYLIHKDLQEGIPQRNNRDTAWWIWGPAQAINIGDGMHSLARKALFELIDQGVNAKNVFEALRIFEDTGLKMCEGQFQDIDFQESVMISPDKYLSMIGNRTASLFSCSFALGASTALLPTEQINSIGLFGHNVGMNFQIQEDSNSIWGNEAQKTFLQHKILNKKKILPVVLALSKGSISIKRRLGEIYFKRVLEKSDLAVLSAILDELNIRKDCENLSKNYFIKSMDILKDIGLPKNQYEILANMTKIIASGNETILS